MSDSPVSYDIIVVGGGNAALCAALTAANAGAKVVVLERSPMEDRGGNTAYTDGLMRTVYNGEEDIKAFCVDLTDQECENADFGTYLEEDFFDDMARITQYRTDPELADLLVSNSRETILWMGQQGIKFFPQFGRQAFRVDGKFKFWGGATIATNAGGPGLVEGLYKAADKAGIEVRYEAWVRGLLRDENGVNGVMISDSEGRQSELHAHAVILACGGFEANAEMRARYLGPGWDLAKVRGSRYNTGDGLTMALDAGAQPYGHWSGCHAVSWERDASDFGDLELTPQYQRHSYPVSIMVNTEGKRFVDEGADFRNYTYAKYGQMVLQQPGQIAWQVYDSKVLDMLRDEYRTRHVSKVIANTLEELADKMEEINKEQFLATVVEFNASVNEDAEFEPNIKDGRSAKSNGIVRSNWACKIDTGPFHAYAVTCGVTFTFGGVKISTEEENRGQIIDTNGHAIPGLFAAGEMVGGIFYFNYPGASGLTSGAVFGRFAGDSAAAYAKAAASQSETV